MSSTERSIDTYADRVKERAQKAGIDKGRVKERAQKAGIDADRMSEEWRDQLGDAVLDVTHEYFGKQYKRRRREDLAKAFAGGVVAGVVLAVLGRMYVKGGENE
ncbi:hypothetical protein ACFO0N_09900 [Halobium salinum]|uniref:DUF3618 domain-containing protein n=1 Tax=Halobium salinum TaxID=1364940 RepID=A0ABD5PC04_9EURY|nr:hypothetical protein [Halobium salinum]